MTGHVSAWTIDPADANIDPFTPATRVTDDGVRWYGTVTGRVETDNPDHVWVRWDGHAGVQDMHTSALAVLAAAPPARPRYRPGMARVGEPTPQSHPERFTDAEVAAEWRYLARLNGKHGVHPLRVGAQNKLRTVMDARGVRPPCGYIIGTPPPAVTAPVRAPEPARGTPGGQNTLRSCAGCSGHLIVADPTSEYVWCVTCKPLHVKPFDEWAASITVGSRVYVQPVVAWRGLSRSEYVVTARDGDTITAQVLGIPESSITVHIGQCGQHDLTPRRI